MDNSLDVVSILKLAFLVVGFLAGVLLASLFAKGFGH